MKRYSILRLFLFIVLMVFSYSFNRFQDAKQDAQLVKLGAGTCQAGLVNMAVKNNSTTKKIDVVIIRKESGGGLTTTSSTKYSGLPPGYKQPIGCGGSSNKDSLVVTYSVAAAIYESN